MAKNPLDEIKKDIEKRYRKALDEFASEMSFQVEAAYESVVQSFYDDYTPRYYKRTGSTYKFSDHFNNEFEYTPFGDEYEYGIRANTNNVEGNPYRADKDWVFERTFGQGIHGFFRSELSEWKANRKVTLGFEYSMSGSNKSAKSFKDFLDSKRNIAPFNIKHAPRRTSIKTIHASTPEKAMDKAFRELTRRKNMDRIWKTIISNEMAR